MRHRVNQSLFALLAAIAAAGCGGNNNTAGAVQTPVTYLIGWGARTRVISGPGSALSVKLTLEDAGPDNSDLDLVTNRHADTAAYTESYTSTELSESGKHHLIVRFYSGADGSGDVVAQGESDVVIFQNGTGIGNISVTNRIKSVAVTPDQKVTLGTPQYLTFTAKDAGDGLVAVSPGSGKWTLVDGDSHLTVDAAGFATPVSVGSANVKVTVDGVSSSTAAVEVVAPEG